MTNRANGTGQANGHAWPIAPEGIPFLLPLGAVGALLTAWTPWGALAFLPAVFSAWFFRNPSRVPPSAPGLLISPADGKVVLVQAMHEPMFLRKNCVRVSIFMSPMDVHVNRMPLSGLVRNVRYTEGKFHIASKPIASQVNEQCAVHIESENGEDVMVVQIAGTLARRIVCDVRPGHTLKAGERFGLIRFGSRVDVYVPEEYDLSVTVGQRVKAGRTVIAVRKSPEASRSVN